jgi:hypothetical protein
MNLNEQLEELLETNKKKLPAEALAMMQEANEKLAETKMNENILGV